MQWNDATELEAVRQYLHAGRGGFFVEVGAHDPEHGSQTWHLEQSGWSGILVEPQRRMSERLKAARPRSRVYAVACGRPDQVGPAEIYVPLMGDLEVTSQASLVRGAERDYGGRCRVETIQRVTLDSLLEQESVPAIDLLSIDTEGCELDVLKGFNLAKYRPRLILLEDWLIYLEKHIYLRRQGYKLVKRTGFNNWYVPRPALPPPTTRREQMELFRKLYLSLVFRKLKEAMKTRSWNPCRRL